MNNETLLAVTPQIIKYIPLHFWTCFFLDSENGSYPTRNPNLQFKCRSQGKFLTGQEAGRIACFMIVLLIYVIGLFGFVTNVLNVVVLRRSLKGASVSMKRLLIMLAVFELFACVFSIVFSTIILSIQENLDRSREIFTSLKIFNVLFGFTRSSSIYISILVTIERYLAVAFLLESKSWLSPLRSKIYLTSVIILAAAVDIPWILNSTVANNTYASLAPNTSLTDFPYIMNVTQFGIVVYPKMRYVLLIMNFVAPFPLLLIFNILLYKSIYAWSKSRQSLTRTQKKEISAAKMFSVVVLVLLSCHTVSCVIFFNSQYFMVIHREFLLLQNFSTTLSAAINFLVYFSFGKSFRQEFRRLMRSQWALVTGQPITTETRTASSRGEGESSIVMPDSGGGIGSRNSTTTCCTG